MNPYREVGKGPYGRVVRLQGAAIRPIPRNTAQITMCTNCKRRSASWEVGQKGPAPRLACSMCVLYELPDMARQREALDGFIEAVEKSRDKLMPRDGEGRLSQVDDADRIAGALIATERVLAVRGRAR